MSDFQGMVRLLGQRFVQRKDVKAFQADDGAWYPTREAMTLSDFEAHFAGTKTMGHYLLDTDNNCKLFAFDIDLVKHGRECPGRLPDGSTCKGCTVRVLGTDGVEYDCIPRDSWGIDHPVAASLTRDLRAMAEGIAWRIYATFEAEVPVAICTSGHKGLHVYGFTGTIPAETARLSAISVLQEFGSVMQPFKGENFWRHNTEYLTLDIEVFPKQTSLDGKDLGNLMSLPLGINRVTGKRKHFVTTRSAEDVIAEMDAERALSGDFPWDI